MYFYTKLNRLHFFMCEKRRLTDCKKDNSRIRDPDNFKSHLKNTRSRTSFHLLQDHILDVISFVRKCSGICLSLEPKT